MNWPEACQILLANDEPPECPQLSAALQKVEVGDLYAAGERLEELDERQRLLATFLVELAAADTDADPGDLARLCERLHGLARNLVDLSDLPHTLLTTWATRVGTRLPPDIVAARDAYGYGPTLSRQVVEHLCADGRAESAIGYAAHIDAHWRDDRARAWAQVGVGLEPGHPERARALGHAAAAGDARPMIQNGGEESTAHGTAMELFARGGLAADDPAVVRSVAGLRKLGRTRARKDVRSHGAAIAAVAAGLRSADSADGGWLQHALALREAIYDAELGARADAALLLAERALGQCDGDAFATRARGLLGESAGEHPELVRELAEGRFRRQPRPEDLAVLRRTGVDVSAETAAALDTWDGYGRREIARFVTGCRLSLGDAELAELLAAIREKERPEALVKGARYGFDGDDERRARYLERGYPEGDRFGIYSADLLHLLSPARRLAGEDFYARTGEAGALAQLAAEAMARGDIADASRAIAKIAQPEVADAWVPYYRRGNRTFALSGERTPTTLQTLDAAGVKAAIKQLDSGQAMYQLARSLRHDPDGQALVAKAAQLKKWSKKMHAPAVARVRLLVGAFDSALELLETLGRGRVDDSQLGRALTDFARELDALALPVTVATAHRLIALFECAHPQFVTGSIANLGRVLIGRCQSGDRTALVEALRAASSRRYRRPADHCFVDMGIARGFAQVGDAGAVLAALRRAVDRASQPATYFKGPSLVRALGELRESLGEKYEPLAMAALEACLVHERDHYAQVMQVERSLRYLWHAGDSRATLAWLGSSSVATIIARDVQRSIWADIEHVPDPLAVLAAAWPRETVVREIAEECVRAAATALRRAGDRQHEVVEALLAPTS